MQAMFGTLEKQRRTLIVLSIGRIRNGDDDIVKSIPVDVPRSTDAEAQQRMRVVAFDDPVGGCDLGPCGKKRVDGRPF